MSQETQIGNLSGGISEEDSKLVDSILNDINNTGGPQQRPQQGQPQQGGGQPSPEQIKMMQQQQMAQQQAMAQQQMSQKTNMIQNEKSNDVLENIKIEAKNVMVVIFLCVLFNIDQVDNLLKGVSMFLSEDGSLNMQAVFLKAVLIGVIFYVVKTYLL